MRIAICICTHKRPVGLRRLLTALSLQKLPESMGAEIDILVVDNDAAESARAVYDSFQLRPAFPTRYAVEPKRGEPHARNTAVRLSTHADLIAFVDDDTKPGPHWLKELLLAQAATSADIVAGSMVPVYLHPAPEWFERGAYLKPMNAAQLGRVDLEQCYVGAGTGNLLVHRRVFDALKGDPFPTKYPLTGGTDTEMVLDAVVAGFTVAPAPAAVNYELVPAERMTRRYLLRRAYAAGQWPVRMSLKYHGLSGKTLNHVAVSGTKLAWCLLRGLLLVPGTDAAFPYVHDAVMHLGCLSAFFRIPPLKRYKNTDGC